MRLAEDAMSRREADEEWVDVVTKQRCNDQQQERKTSRKVRIAWLIDGKILNGGIPILTEAFRSSTRHRQMPISTPDYYSMDCPTRKTIAFGSSLSESSFELFEMNIDKTRHASPSRVIALSALGSDWIDRLRLCHRHKGMTVCWSLRLEDLILKGRRYDDKLHR